LTSTRSLLRTILTSRLVWRTLSQRWSAKNPLGTCLLLNH